MPDSIDYGKVDIEILFSDPSVTEFLKIADEHPMWKVRQMVESLSNIPGVHTLTYEEAKIVLNRLGLSTQSSRIAQISKVRETGTREYKEVHPIAVDEAAADKIEQTQKVPEVTKIIQITQTYISKPAEKKTDTQNIIADRIYIFKSIKDFLRLIFHFRIRFVSIYYVPVFFLLVGVIIWLSVKVFFQKESFSTTDLSLPVSLGNTADMKGLQGITATGAASQ